MLVLSRHRDEQIILGSGLVKVTVVDLRSDKVRLGIEAPYSLPVHRREVHDAIVRDGGRNLHDEFLGQLLGVGNLDLAGVPGERMISVGMPTERALREALAAGFVRFTPAMPRAAAG